MGERAGVWFLESRLLAALRGGECLSDRDPGRHGRLRWRCKEGHEWEARLVNVRYGAWCHHCGRTRRSSETERQARLAELQRLAASRGWRCLSPVYVNGKQEMRWRCPAGHEWTASANVFVRRVQCKVCATSKRSLAALRMLAAERGGVCLSGEVVTQQTPMRWRCAAGHEWEASAAATRRGRWCSTCAGHTPWTLARLQEIARRRGGVCLADRYEGPKVKVSLRCALGHTWSTFPTQIVRGKWCPRCGNVARRTIEEMRAIAAERGGACLSPTYINSSTKLRWRCKERHEWTAEPRAIVRGTWCPACGRARARHRRLTLADVQLAASIRGGRCLSRTWPGHASRLRFDCGFGHVFQAAAYSVVRGSWCPQCAGHVPVGAWMKEIQTLARERGGRCLSSADSRSQSALEWECEQGHRWKARVAAVKQGTWCPVCAGVLPLGIDAMRRLAHERGGKCLSRSYTNSRTPLEWQCAAGHRWSARPSTVRNGRSWCPHCAGKAPDTLERMQAVAAARGGACLADRYLNTLSRLQWRCAEGHTWTSTASSVVRGTWCPTCAVLERRKAKHVETVRASRTGPPARAR